MIVRATLAAAALTAAVVGPAEAQRARLVPSAPHIAAFGACAARNMPDRARELMATAMDSRAERRIAQRIADSRSSCLSTRLRSLSMYTGAFRGAVAEALIEGDSAAIERLRRMPPTAAARVRPGAGRAVVAAYARCLADADPPRSLALLEAEPASARERDAMLSFGDLLNDCMPFGSSFRIDPVDVRNHIAARLYDIAFPAEASTGR